MNLYKSKPLSVYKKFPFLSIVPCFLRPMFKFYNILRRNKASSLTCFFYKNITFITKSQRLRKNQSAPPEYTFHAQPPFHNMNLKFLMPMPYRINSDIIINTPHPPQKPAVCFCGIPVRPFTSPPKAKTSQSPKAPSNAPDKTHKKSISAVSPSPHYKAQSAKRKTPPATQEN